MSETDDWLNAQAALGPARPPATYGEIADADWAAAGLQTPFGVRQPLADAAGELNDAYQRATGTPAHQAAAAAGYSWPEGFPEAQAAIVHTLTERLPDAQAREVAPYADVSKRAADKAQAIEAEGADVGARTYGLTGNALAWTAGIARTLVDPTSLAGAAVGAPEAGLLKNWIVREAAVNGVFGLGVHAVVAPEREQLGLPTESLLRDVAASAAGGVALGGLMRGAGWALGRIFDRADPRLTAVSRETLPDGVAPAAAPPPPAAREALQAIEPEDFHAAADFVEARGMIEAEAGPDGASRLALAGRIDDAAQAIDAGATPVDRIPAEAIEAPEAAPDGGAAAPALPAERRPLADYPLPDEITRPAAPPGEADEAGAAGAAAAPAAGAAGEGRAAETSEQGNAPASVAPVRPVAAAAEAEGEAALMAARRGEAERVLTQAPDLEVHLPGDQPGSFVKVGARQALAEADEDAAGARELAGCIAGDATTGETE